MQARAHEALAYYLPGFVNGVSDNTLGCSFPPLFFCSLPAPEFGDYSLAKRAFRPWAQLSLLKVRASCNCRLKAVQKESC